MNCYKKPKYGEIVKLLGNLQKQEKGLVVDLKDAQRKKKVQRKLL